MTLLVAHDGSSSQSILLKAPNDLLTAINTAASEFDKKRTSVSMFLIKKTASKDVEEKYQLGSVDVAGQVANEFRDIIGEKLAELDTQTFWEGTKFVDFYDEKIQFGDLSEVKSKDILFFKHIHNQIRGHTELDQITDLAEVKHFESFAVAAHLTKGAVIYFSRIPKARLVTKKFGLTLLFSQGRFNKIEGDVLAVDKNMDCLYFEKTDSLLVFNKYNTEIIFNFKEYYQRIAVGVFKALAEQRNLIRAEQSILDDAFTKSKFIRRITRLQRDAKFNKDISYFNKMLTYLVDNPQKYNPDKVQLVIKDNKVIIDSLVRLNTFLRVCNNEAVEDVIEHRLFLANDKEDALSTDD